jgi:hypothetical protein
MMLHSPDITQNRYMKSVLFLLFLLTVTNSSSIVRAQGKKADLGTFAQSTQMIVVTVPDWNTIDGQLQRFERASTHDAWQSAGEPIAVVVGKNGMGWGFGVITVNDPRIRTASDPVKKEGDNKSPAGVFDLGTAFGDAEQPLQGSKLPYLSLTASVECVDDVSSRYYNRVVDRTAVNPDWNSSEHMRNVGDPYRWGIVVDNNSTVATNADHPVPGGGSCVFLHIWRGSGRPTAGCTAMAQPNLESLLLWLDPARHPLLVQMPEQKYELLARRWKLPALTQH